MNEKVIVHTIAGQSEKKEEKKNDRDTRRFYSEKNTRTKVREKQNIIVKSFPGAELDCIYHYAIPTVKSNPDRIIMHCGTSNLKMDESPEAIAEKTMEVAKSVKSTTNEVVISSIIPRRDKLADKGSKVNGIVSKISVKKMRQSNLCGKNLLIQRNILERMAYTSIILALTKLQKNFLNF